MRSKPPPHVSNLRWSIVPALAGPLEPHERIPNAPEDRNIADPAIAKKVEEELAAGKLWPDPLLQFNPAYESAGAVADVRRIVASRTLGRRSSPARDGGFRPVERRNPARGSCRKAAGVPLVVLNERMETNHGHLSVATMHLAKGLEFRAVAVMACDDAVIPLQERIESVADESDR